MTDVTVKNKKSFLRTCAYTYAGKFFINYLSYPSSVIEKWIMSPLFFRGDSATATMNGKNDKDMMKKLLLLFVLAGYTMSIHADDIVLTNKSDSLSYALGLAYIAVFAGNTVDFVETEEGREAFIKGLEQQINERRLNSPTLKSFHFGALRAAFLLNTIEHKKNSFCVDGLIEGIRDGAEGNYSKMDTLQCKAFLSNYQRPSDDEEIKDSASFWKASYAYGMLRVCPAAFEVTMTEFDVAEPERSLQEYANGFIAILSVYHVPKDSYEYGLQIGASFLMGQNDIQSIKINPLIMVQALKDFLLQRPLLIPREQAESMVMRILGDYETNN